MENDTRGWILSAISGIACCFGASIICVDVFVRQFPGMRHFKISESDAFLSASLSLSAGVILFSSLYSMLPESKNYLKKGGYGPKQASFLLIGLFLVGVFGIRILSQILHKFIPSHVVDCDHTHEEADKGGLEEVAEDENDYTNEIEHDHENNISKTSEPSETQATEATPLLSQSSTPKPPQRTTTAPGAPTSRNSQINSFVTAPNSRRPSSAFGRTLTRTITKYVSSKKDECDEDGPCMGFSDPCGVDCFKIVQRRTTLVPGQVQANNRAPSWQRVPSDFRYAPPVPEDDRYEPDAISPALQEDHQSRRVSEPHNAKPGQRSRSATQHFHRPEQGQGRRRQSSSHHRSGHNHQQTDATDHHHHVPTNAFMSIGLQTSIAIALHKAPEGFITFATNHVNPTLGFSVFIALFIHNITEGFALSLPLFLALNSRLKAIIWSSILGGLSQPAGAGIAALWFKLADQSGHLAPDERVYGGIFAVTAGVMASVALSLISESLQLSHNKNTCITFAFVGMALLGVSTALTAS